MESLKALRLKKGVNQVTVAKHLGITSQAYGHYEAGRRQPDNDMLQKLADYFGVSVDYLLGREEKIGIHIPPELENVQVAFSGDLEKDLTPKEIEAMKKFREILLGQRKE